MFPSMLWMDSDDVPPKAMNLNYTKHAVHAIAERVIPVEWVERVVANPVLRVPDPNWSDFSDASRNTVTAPCA